MINNQEIPKDLRIKWHLKPLAVIAAILLLGPFALPLVWLSPAFKKSHKIIITIIIALLTVWLVIASVRLYSIVFERMRQLQELMR